MENSILISIQKWYASQCDGDWEHEYGIMIDTLDNPGWSVTIDLIGTELEEKKFSDINSQISVTNWVQCSVKNKKFHGAGGAENLFDVLETFLKWTKSQ